MGHMWIRSNKRQNYIYVENKVIFDAEILKEINGPRICATESFRESKGKYGGVMGKRDKRFLVCNAKVFLH